MAIAQFSGLASGIDSGALIDAIIEARETRNEIRRNQISHLESENDALEEINTKLLALSDLVDAFRTANGGGVSKKATSSDPTVATAIAGSNAPGASLSLEVTSVADTATQSIYNGTTAWDSLSDVFNSGSGSETIDITIGDGASAELITVNIEKGSTTVNDVISQINEDANADGRIYASAVNVGTDAAPEYQIVLTTLKQGVSEGKLTVALSGGIDEALTSAVDQATNAVFSIQGINGTIQRETNSVSDVISGMTLVLSKAGSATISVSNDASGTAEKVNEIIEAFNDIVNFVNENNTVTQSDDDDDGTIIYGSLAQARVDDDFLSQFRLELSGASSDSGTDVTSMAELGISTNRDGTLSFDSDKFEEAVGNDPNGATEVLRDFADTAGGVSGIIYQYTKLSGFIDIAQDGNSSEIDNLNDAIDALERFNEKLRESLERQFTNLETVVGKLQSDQQALSGILAGLG